MDILHHIDRLEELVGEARKLPVGGGLVLSRQRLLELSREAEAQAAARLDDAQNAAREQMREADVYALQTLRKLETELSEFIATVRRGIDTLEKRAAERPG